MKTKTVYSEKAIYLFLFLIISVIGYSQTYIGPSIGYSFSNVNGMSPEDIRWNYVTTEGGFKKKSWLVGFRIEQYLKDNITISLNPIYTNKTANYNDIGIVGYHRLEYDQISAALTMNIRLIKNWFLGFGGNVDYLFDFELIKDIPEIRSSRSSAFNSQQLGWNVNTSFRYKNVILEVKLTKGEKIYGKFDSLLQSSNSIDLTLNYLFRVSKNRKN